MFVVTVEMHQGSVLSLFLPVVVDVTKSVREGVLSEMLCADYLILMSKIIEEIYGGFESNVGKLTNQKAERWSSETL